MKIVIIIPDYEHECLIGVHKWMRRSKMDEIAKIKIIMLGLIQIAAIAGFVYLACHFEHWWIALFSLLFAFSIG